VEIALVCMFDCDVLQHRCTSNIIHSLSQALQSEQCKDDEVSVSDD